MKVFLISDNPVSEWMGKPLHAEGCSFHVAAQPEGVDADLIIDPFLEQHPSWINIYKEKNIPVLIGSTCYTLQELQVGNAPIARYNWWPGANDQAPLEISAAVSHQPFFTPFLERLGIQGNWLPDTIGFITPRIIACIINEAYLAAEEDIASPADIDTAMRLGTNYPLGPFAWCEKIGKQHVANLLQALAAENSIYTPAASLLQ